MEVLDQVYWGNTVRAWIVAGAVGAGLFALLVVGRRFVRKWLAAHPEASTKRFRLIFSALLATRFFFLGIIAIYTAGQLVHLPPRWRLILNSATVVLLLLQIALWGTAIIGRWIEDHVRRRATLEDRASATTIAVMGIIARA